MKWHFEVFFEDFPGILGVFLGCFQRTFRVPILRMFSGCCRTLFRRFSGYFQGRDFRNFLWFFGRFLEEFWRILFPGKSRGIMRSSSLRRRQMITGFQTIVRQGPDFRLPTITWIFFPWITDFGMPSSPHVDGILKSETILRQSQISYFEPIFPFYVPMGFRRQS